MISVVKVLSCTRLGALPLVLLLTIVLSLSPAAIAQDQSARDVLAQADQILQQMSQITGLPVKSPVRKQIISRKEIEKYLVAKIHEEIKPEELHAQEALVRVLGLVPRDFDLEKFLVNFYTEQAAGFYDPKQKTMFIADWSPADTQALILSHELTHALQDENWDLQGYLEGARDDDDATAARQAVVEGEATVAMFQNMMGGQKLDLLPSLSDLMDTVVHQQLDEYPAYTHAPFFFRMQATFPYVQGAGFIQAGMKGSGWKNLDQYFQHPPESTQEIFDPELYFAHPVLLQTALAHPPAFDGTEGMRLLRENRLGELGYYSVVGQLISEDEAKLLSPAWRADRYVLYERPSGKDYALVARVQWANAKAARQFFRDYSSILSHRYPDLARDKRSNTDAFISSTSDGAAILLVKGNECWWAQGVPPDQADAILAWLQNL